MPRVTVLRHEHFNAAHRLHNPALGDDENRRIFGKCNSPNYHGHNYELVLEVTGEVDPTTGYVIDLGILSALFKREIEARFDHRNLNLDCPEFDGLNPTAEHIAIVVHGLLAPHLPPDVDLAVTLYETPRNAVRYPAKGDPR